MKPEKYDFEWNWCSMVWDGKQCTNRARYKNGSKCCTCANRLYNIKNPDYNKNYHKEYYKKNPEKIKAKQQRYYYSHKEAERDRNFLYRYHNRDKVKLYEQTVRNPRRRAERQAARALRAKGLPSDKPDS